MIYRTASDNLEFVHVDDSGTVGPPVPVTSVDASPDLAPAVHFIGSDSTFDGLPTPYVALYTATGGGLTCVRLAADGAPVPSGSATLGTSASLSASVLALNLIAVARHDAVGLSLLLMTLRSTSSSVPACESLGTLPLRGSDTYIHPPAIAWNGVEWAVTYDVEHIAPGTGAPVRLVGVAIWNPMAGAPTNRLFDGPAHVPGERPSITWAERPLDPPLLIAERRATTRRLDAPPAPRARLCLRCGRGRVTPALGISGPASVERVTPALGILGSASVVGALRHSGSRAGSYLKRGRPPWIPSARAPLARRAASLSAVPTRGGWTEGSHGPGARFLSARTHGKRARQDPERGAS